MVSAGPSACVTQQQQWQPGHGRLRTLQAHKGDKGSSTLALITERSRWPLGVRLQVLGKGGWQPCLALQPASLALLLLLLQHPMPPSSTTTNSSALACAEESTQPSAARSLPEERSHHPPHNAACILNGFFFLSPPQIKSQICRTQSVNYCFSK